MSVLKLENIYYSVGQFPLLDSVNYLVEPKQRIALIGRNGEGKSTLMKIISGKLQAESGSIIKGNTTSVAMLAQDLPNQEDKTVFEVVAQGLKNLSELLVKYHELTTTATDHGEKWLNELNRVQQQIEVQNGWDVQQRIEVALEELKLPADTLIRELSGGWRRKVALAQSLVQQPDLLLLDEPTNHLDLEAIDWLESRLLNYPNTIMFITHDRKLLRKLATSILELDRGHLTQYPPDYDVYLERKEKSFEDEQKANKLFDKRLADEEKWIRQGVKARRTRNEGRVRALKALREERTQRRERKGKASFEAFEEAKKGKMVIQAEEVNFAYNSGPNLIDDFSFNIQRGDKIAIVGANGAGKTTLVKLLLGQLEPTSGTIKHSPTNKIAFFDQTRQSLNLEQSLIDNVAEGEDFIEIDGKRKHIIGYLGEFLFPPQKCHSMVRTLSGGEQNRLMLAKLFSKPANLYVLDEPTNDLDIETLEILESILLNMQGSVIVISHDREFIDNVATYTISLEKDKPIAINVGGYTDWLERAKSLESKPSKKGRPKEVTQKATTEDSSKTTKKLSFNEQQELKELPSKVEKLEKKIEAVQAVMAEEDFYLKNQEDIKKVSKELDALKTQLDASYKRWEALDS